MSNTTLSTNLLRALAIMQHRDEPFFILGESAYEGSEEDAKQSFKDAHAAKMEAGDITEEDDYQFSQFCAEELTEVEELDAHNEKDCHIALTDSEADESAAESIKDSLWAFNPSFLAGETGIDQEVFQAIADNNRCEGNNDAIARLIGDIDGFVESAIGADGRGHFLNTYDGNEYEETVEGETFFIYRMN